jgi:hypothetical protein
MIIASKTDDSTHSNIRISCDEEMKLLLQYIDCHGSE